MRRRCDGGNRIGPQCSGVAAAGRLRRLEPGGLGLALAREFVALIFSSVALGLVFSRGLALCGLIPGRIGFGRVSLRSVSLRSVSLGSIAPGGIYFGQLFAAWLASLAQPLLGARFAAIGPALARGLNWSLTLRSRSCGVGRLCRPRQPLGVAAAARGLGLRR